MKILFVNHSEEQCGVHQFGDMIGLALEKYQERYEWVYALADDPQTFKNIYNSVEPDAVIFNWFPTTMAWYEPIKDQIDCIKIGVVHEVNQIWGDNFQPMLDRFDYVILPDITFKQSEYYQPSNKVFTTNRGIPDYFPTQAPKDFTVGSFGFGFDLSKYARLIDKVQDEFDTAVIRLHIPYASFGDRDGNSANEIGEYCVNMMEDGFVLDLNHNFMSRAELLDWLSGNSLNCFLYSGGDAGRGIASTPDYGLAVKRPMAISRATMFRHIYDPLISADDSTLKEIYDRGIEPLKPYYQWTMQNLVHEYESIIDEIKQNIR